MSACISGPVVTTNARLYNPNDPKSRLVLLDGHFYLANDLELMVLLKFFNKHQLMLADPNKPDKPFVMIFQASVSLHIRNLKRVEANA